MLSPAAKNISLNVKYFVIQGRILVDFQKMKGLLNKAACVFREVFPHLHLWCILSSMFQAFPQLKTSDSKMWGVSSACCELSKSSIISNTWWRCDEARKHLKHAGEWMREIKRETNTALNIPLFYHIWATWIRNHADLLTQIYFFTMVPVNG